MIVRLLGTLTMRLFGILAGQNAEKIAMAFNTEFTMEANVEALVLVRLNLIWQVFVCQRSELGNIRFG